MPHQFYLVDVFTARPFGGNQLAVFPDAANFPADRMQSVAREFNFPETTFVVPARDPACAARVRIFTPRAELPFAGHPTIGTTAVLAHLGRLAASADGSAHALLEEGVGPIAVATHRTDGVPFARLELAPRLELPGPGPDAKRLAAALTSDEDCIRESAYASVGVPFIFVRLDSADAVDRAVLDRTAWAATFVGAFANHVFIYAGDTAPGGHLYARMFAPALGIDEDPATGAACATLAGMLAAVLPAVGGAFTWRIEQGVKMGRPSEIEASAVKRDGRVTTVSVGGDCVIVGDGQINVV